MKASRLPLLFALAACLFASCSKEPDKVVYISRYQATEYKMAIVLPISSDGEYALRLQEIASYALYNMRKAQNYVASSGDSLIVDITTEWYDEDKVNLDSLATALAGREDLLLAIGPLRNENVDLMASAFKTAGKPLIVPYATSENIIRRYAVTKSGDKAEQPFLWSLCETDVSQSKALLAKAWESGAKSVALLTPDDEYGQTFYEWVPFLATEMGMELSPSNIFQYSDDLSAAAEKALKTDVDYIICAVGSAPEAEVVLRAKQKLGDKTPRILFSNGALSAYLLQLGDLAEGAEGIAPYADPSTGFEVAYEERYSRTLAGAEAQVYDALLLAGITAFVKNHLEEDMDTNEIIRLVTSLGDEPYPIWNELGMRSLLTLLHSEEASCVKLVGACGALRFDSEACTSLIQSTYVHWVVYDGKFLTLDYMSDDGSNRTASTLAAWNWRATVNEQIEDQDSPVEYKELEDRYALLVQGSSGWANYRHQADVLNVYQMLKRYGWDDDHIILAISDELIDNKKNIFKAVSTSTYGENLYEGAVIDYDTDTLKISDIQDIMLGRSSGHLPTVLNTSDRTDVLVFWSGHGCLAATHKVNGFVWRDTGKVFSESDFRSTLEQMHSGQRYRKMLLLLEPCYSRNMARQTREIPGILGIASAGSAESSFADYHSADLKIWMSDRFSNNLVNTLSDKPSQTYRDLYEYLYTHTLGSHVYVENSYWFGDLCKTSPEEFIVNN